MLLSYPTWLDGEKLLQEVRQDTMLQKTVKELQMNPDLKAGFTVQQGILFYQGRLVLSPNSPSIPLLLKEFHETPMEGHSGFLRTYRRLAANLYWPRIQRWVRDFVRACDVC